MAALLLKTFLCGLELHERSHWRVITTDTHHICSPIHRVHTLQARMYITIWCATMLQDNKSHKAYDCTTLYTPNVVFTGNDASVCMKDILRADLRAATVQSIYVHVAVSSAVNAISTLKLILKLIKLLPYFVISLASMHELVYCKEKEFDAKQQKKYNKNK